MSDSRTDDITYGLATETDVPGIQFTAEESWRATYRGIYTDTFISEFLARNYSAEGLLRSVNSQRTTLLVAREDEIAVVGFCHYGPSLGGDDIELYRLYVDPDYWGLGIGRTLLGMMEDRLREQGIDHYGLYVHALNEIGKAFYFKHGFIHDERRDKPEEDHWYLVKQL
jgi:diamine N-acetyltransferase